MTACRSGRSRLYATMQRARKVLTRAQWAAMSSNPLRQPSVKTLLRQPTGYGHAPLVCEIEGPVYLEPRFGYVISKSGHLIEDAVRPNFAFKSPWRLEIPSPREIAGYRRNGRVQKVGRVVSLRHWWEWNYYHFYMDVLGKLATLEKSGVDHRTPLVIGGYYNQIPWVRDILEMGDLKSRDWLIQQDVLLEADSLVYCRAQVPFRSRVTYLARATGAPQPDSDPRSERRIFLTRQGDVSRQICNLDEVRETLNDHGYEEVDSARLSIKDQMELFANTRYMVAIHGAGLTNLIFRQGHPLDVIELYGAGYNSGNFSAICEELGYGWRGVEGELVGADPQLANIEVDVVALAAALFDTHLPALDLDRQS